MNFIISDERDACTLIGLISQIRRDRARIEENCFAAFFENGLVNVPRDKNICAKIFSHLVFVGVFRQKVPVIYDDAFTARGLQGRADQLRYRHCREQSRTEFSRR